MPHRYTTALVSSLKASLRPDGNAIAAKCSGIHEVKKMDHRSASFASRSTRGGNLDPDVSFDELTFQFSNNLHLLRSAECYSHPRSRVPAGFLHYNYTDVPIPVHFLQPVGPFLTRFPATLRTFATVAGMDPVEQPSPSGQAQQRATAGASKKVRRNDGIAFPVHELPLPCNQGNDNCVPVQEAGQKRKPEIYYDWGSTEGGDKVHCTSLSVEELEAAGNQWRNWEYTDIGFEHLQQTKPGREFTLMSYNVLAQCLLDGNYYLYRHCHPDILQWDYRKGVLLKEFQRANADVLCLQEVQNEHFGEFFVPELEKLGYSGIYKKRTGDKNDGCAIFYRNSMFVLEDSISVEYCKPGLDILDRDNIALIAMLKPKGGAGHAGSQKVCIANTHLLFNPGRGDIKLAQLRILLAEIDKFAFCRLSHSQRPFYHPVVLCGDMNSEPDCPLYKFVGTGSLSYEGLVAGDISGQTEGMFRGRFILNKELVPQFLGISDQCQYIDTLQQRIGDLSAAQRTIKKLKDAKSTPTGNANPSGAEGGVLYREKERTGANPDIQSKGQPVFSSGRMTHRLNLVSAYKHELERLPGRPPTVTTHHCKASCTVDYIFYSVHSKRSLMKYGRIVHQDLKEGLLSLLATYGLLGENELQHLGGLPNAAQPSDHLPLVAKFLLRDS